MQCRCLFGKSYYDALAVRPPPYVKLAEAVDGRLRALQQASLKSRIETLATARSAPFARLECVSIAARSPLDHALSRADDDCETRENSGYCRVFSAGIQFEFARKHSRIAPGDKVNYTEN